MKINRRLSIVIFIIVFTIITGHAQNSSASRFVKEVETIQRKYDSVWDATQPTIVFTGSSSVRLWKDLEERFPKHQILNTGFGGSTTSDLFMFLEELVIYYQPKKVFIYEGDNDISAKQSKRSILKQMMQVVERIRTKSPNTDIIFISPKPSISRWKLKGKYKRLNKSMQKWAEKDGNLVFVDVWDVMLDGRKVNQSLFIEDGLHMNSTGYDLWYQQIKPYLD